MQHWILRILKIWRQLTSYRISKELPYQEARKIQIVQGAAIITFLAFLYTTLFFLAVGEFMNWFPNLLGIAISLWIYGLCQAGYYTWARHSVVLYNFHILYMAWTWGPGTVLELLPIASGLFALIFFDRRSDILLHLLISIATIFVAHYFYSIRTEFVPVPYAERTYYSNIMLLFMVSIFGLLTFRNEQTNYERRLEKANDQITSSIRYAQRIQKGLLGKPERIYEDLAGGMVFFRPRDIVSGDFYWKGTVGQKQILVAADCTGHGVPGAFMTVLGTSILEEIVHNQNISDPQEILTRLDAQVIQSVASKGSETPDGMDMALIMLDREEKTITFAGAKNPLFQIMGNEPVYTKGSVFPIGSTQFKKPKVFKKHTFPWQPGAKLYLFSDGFQDQFGGEEGRKYLSKRFRQFLLSISHQPWENQAEKLQQELTKWQGAYSQTDDILVMGVELD
ncbi:MAG TPA: hypothetical protein DCE41_15990 [Cytophagales bacterium]|nr:hypothetical protein [Cytophagales bacterium]HAA20507.1 hypothetical protein [Cytophagales bacterium]HAP59065.1 hypothetical protein [Cytophagales bacterium]